MWHHHVTEDELFLVTKGTLHMAIRDPHERTTTIGPGEFIIVPRMVEHRPFTTGGEEVEIILLEPKTTLNTGTAEKSELTVEELGTVA